MTPRMAKLRRLWAFLSDWQAETPQQSPTLREIVDGLGMSSTSVAAYWVNELEASGYITQALGFRAARTIRVLIPLMTVSRNGRRMT